MLRSKILRFVGLVLFWSAVAAVFTVNTHVLRIFTGRTQAFGRMLAWDEMSWAFWWFGSILVFYLAGRFPLDRGRWRRNALLHLAATTGLIVLMTAWDVTILRTVGHWVDFSPVVGAYAERSTVLLLRNWMLAEAPWGLVIYGLVLAAWHARAYYRSYRDEELAASKLEAQLHRTRLQVLMMQLQPHFLFNTLHAVSALIHSDPDKAEQVIIRLAQLLRHALDNADRLEVPLNDELEFLRAYLAIAQVRVGDRLVPLFDIAPESRDALVPPMILQPIVENALRHGLGPERNSGRIEIRSRVRERHLELEVWNDGRGLTGNGNGEGQGVGLPNTRQRLAALYGDDQRLTVHEVASGGVAATLVLPLRKSIDGGDGGDADDPHGDRGRRATRAAATALAARA